MWAYFLVFLGGGLGSICRFAIANLFAQWNWTSPLATLTANVVSCIILGYLIGLELKFGLEMKQRWLLMAGFCGGFSTFSTFSGESFELLKQQQFSLFFLYITASILLCLICIVAGYRLA